MDWTEPNICLAENLTTDEAGLLRLQPWTVPRLVADVRVGSGGDGAVSPTLSLPGKLLINQQLSWTNETPLDQMVLIRVTRASRSLVTSNPNAIQFRDRWTTAIDRPAEMPVTTGLFNGQSGAALDVGTNSVAEPYPGVLWVWQPANTAEEWVGPVAPGSQFHLWYRCYVWTPPPWSDNANKNSPVHAAYANWTRIQLVIYGQQDDLVSG